MKAAYLSRSMMLYLVVMVNGYDDSAGSEKGRAIKEHNHRYVLHKCR